MFCHLTISWKKREKDDGYMQRKRKVTHILKGWLCLSWFICWSWLMCVELLSAVASTMAVYSMLKHAFRVTHSIMWLCIYTYYMYSSRIWSKLPKSKWVHDTNLENMTTLSLQSHFTMTPVIFFIFSLFPSPNRKQYFTFTFLFFFIYLRRGGQQSLF